MMFMYLMLKAIDGVKFKLMGISLGQDADIQLILLKVNYIFLEETIAS